jgi:hypothetical protein
LVTLVGARLRKPFHVTCYLCRDCEEAKSHIWLFHVTSVVIVKQQDGDKKAFSPTSLKGYPPWSQSYDV